MDTIRDEPINFVQIQNFIESAVMKLGKAEEVISIDEQTGFQMAYDAMLRVSLGFMLSLGKRPRSTVGHHRIVIDFVAEQLGGQYQSIMKMFDIMRKKRNEAIYEPVSTITEKEAKDAIATARKYFAIIIEEIRVRNPQQQLRF